MGNHDDRAAFRAGLLGGPATTRTGRRVYDVNGLRIIALDSTVPGHHYGDVSESQLDWLADELGDAAHPHGTILAMHHPPIPSVLDLAVSVELRDQAGLAEVLEGSDVRSIIAGHLHYSSTATFAGIPVSVASATCYTQDLNVPGRRNARPGRRPGLQPRARLPARRCCTRSFRSGSYPALDYVDAEESARRLAADGIRIPGALQTAADGRSTRRREPFTLPV